MLSLSPRFDQFRFLFPKNFIPEELNEKYMKILNRDPAIITTPIDYLNESILGISFPGISDINIQQEQHGSNPIQKTLHRLNVEPKHEITYTSSSNPLESINKEFKVTFRLNQGLYNYFLIYEIIFYHICKNINKPPLDVAYIELLNEDGNIVSRIQYKDIYIDGLDGLDFNYNKIEREAGTFDVSFKFNNIDFEYIDLDTNKVHTIYSDK